MSEAREHIKQSSLRRIIGARGNKWITMVGLALGLVLITAACGFATPGQSTEAQDRPVTLAAYEPSELGVTANSVANVENNDSATTGQQEENTVNRSDITAGNQETSTADSMNTSTAVSRTAPSATQATTEQARTIGSYNGEIEPDNTVVIAAEVNGSILNVLVDVGDVVQAGEVLVEIDSAILQGQQAQAVAGLKAAQAQLDQLLGDADPEDLEAARAAVNAAATVYRELTDGPREQDLRIAEANLRQSEAAVQRAQNAYNQVKWRNDIGALPQSEQLHVATLAFEAAQAQYEKIVEGATSDVIAGAYAQLVQARTQLTNLQNGADTDRIAAAEAQVEQAEAALYLASVQLAKTTIRAPMDGIVMGKNTASGAIAAPGAPLLTLMSREMNVVIPVEELQLAQIEPGQTATLRVNAYPDQAFEGEVLRIAPQLDAATRTVEVTIRPRGTQATQLRPGMFASVELFPTLTADAADAHNEPTDNALASLRQ